ncbi:hypothetical protein KFU94_42675 [Chloroflexi bacterium TSY]|nr:hypothetical protein [Chloroflexi bacterium TSY]
MLNLKWDKLTKEQSPNASKASFTSKGSVYPDEVGFVGEGERLSSRADVCLKCLNLLTICLGCTNKTDRLLGLVGHRHCLDGPAKALLLVHVK